MSQTRSAAVTGSDVAKKAGVSRAAVSSVLGGSRGTIRVSEQTRRKIIAAAREFGYSPHPAARALRKQRSGVIGLVLRSDRREVYEQPIPYEISLYLFRAVQRLGYHLVEASADDPATVTEEDSPVRNLLRQRVDGLIFDHPDSAREVRSAVEVGVPVVQLMRPQISVDTSSVAVDAVGGIYEAIEHLVALGHRRLGFVGYHGTHPADLSRQEAFVSGLAQCGITVGREYLRDAPGWTPQDGYEPTKELLHLGEPPTALFVASDTLALGVLRALYEARFRVPEQMSVISYDDAFAGHLYPPLTSVSQPFREVAECALASVSEQIENPEVHEDSVRLTLPTALTIRESTAEPP